MCSSDLYTAGLIQMALNVPVVAMGNGGNPTTWYIRGGLNNGMLDAGPDPVHASGALCGAIMLGFADPWPWDSAGNPWPWSPIPDPR